MEISLAHGPAGTEIAGLGHAQPVRVMDNHELEGMMDTNDEWIRQRTGIITRHIVASISIHTSLPHTDRPLSGIH